MYKYKILLDCRIPGHFTFACHGVRIVPFVSICVRKNANKWPGILKLLPKIPPLLVHMFLRTMINEMATH